MFIIPCLSCKNIHYKHVFDLDCIAIISHSAYEKLERIQEMFEVTISHEFVDRIIFKSDIGIIIEYNIYYNIKIDDQIVFNGSIYKELLRYICNKCPKLLRKSGNLDNFILEDNYYIHKYDHNKYVKLTPKIFSYIGLLCTNIIPSQEEIYYENSFVMFNQDQKHENPKKIFKFIGCILYDKSIKLISNDYKMIISISPYRHSLKINNDITIVSNNIKDIYDEVVKLCNM